MTRFDRYLAVDWSAAAVPRRGHDSIWTAEVDHSAAPVVRHNPPTRHGAVDRITRRLGEAVVAGERVLVGVDVAFGFPAGTASALGVDGWSGVWALVASLISDDEHNRNNRFGVAADLNARMGPGPGPFWACPTGAAGPALATTKGTFPHDTHRLRLAEHRRCEAMLRSKRAWVQSVWKLFAPASVGGQTLTAIARLEPVRHAWPGLSEHVAVWPFETTEAALSRRPLVVLCELWPGIVGAADDHPVRDARQVADSARWMRDLDIDGSLDSLLLLTGTDAADRQAAVAEEGWILGAESVRS